jgi:Protein of unknown function DUF262
MVEIFREFVLTIPDYQRGYAWESKEVGDFLDDIDLLPVDRSHYTGTLILDPGGDDRASNNVEDAAGTPYRRAEVVDGQQRLTTIVIALSAIARELLAAGETQLGQGLRSMFVEATCAVQKSHRARSGSWSGAIQRPIRLRLGLSASPRRGRWAGHNLGQS